MREFCRVFDSGNEIADPLDSGSGSEEQGGIIRHTKLTKENGHMKNMKKVVVGAVAVLALAACSSTEGKTASEPEATSSTSTTESTTEATAVMPRNPVDLLKKIPNCTPEGVNGETDIDGNRFASCSVNTDDGYNITVHTYAGSPSDWDDGSGTDDIPDDSTVIIEGADFDIRTTDYEVEALGVTPEELAKKVGGKVTKSPEATSTPSSTTAATSEPEPVEETEEPTDDATWACGTDGTMTEDEWDASECGEAAATGPQGYDCSTPEGMDTHNIDSNEFPCLPGQDVNALSTLVYKPASEIPADLDWSLFCTNGEDDRLCGNDESDVAPVN